MAGLSLSFSSIPTPMSMLIPSATRLIRLTRLLCVRMLCVCVRVCVCVRACVCVCVRAVSLAEVVPQSDLADLTADDLQLLLSGTGGAITLESCRKVAEFRDMRGPEVRRKAL